MMLATDAMLIVDFNGLHDNQLHVIWM